MPGRWAARRAGGWRSRCAPCRRACSALGASLVLRKGLRRPRSSPGSRARPAPARCTGTRSRRRRTGPWPIRSPRRWARSASPSQRFPGDLLVAPRQIRNKENRGLRVFTPFWRRVQSLGDPPKPLPAPKKLNGVPPTLPATRSKSWHLEPTKPDWAGGLRESWTPGEASAQARLKAVPQGRRRRLFRRSRPARSRRHLAAVAASAFRRDQPAPDLARRALCRSRTPAPVSRYRQIPQRTRLARILPSSAVRRTRSRDAQSAAVVRRLSLEARRQGVARLAARPDRLSHRRCRHARTLAHRRDAQPGADGGGVVPGQASPDRLARRRAMVLGHAGRCRCRQQSGQLAMGRRLRRRRRALLPGLQSDPAGREIRSRRRLCQALGAGAGSDCPTS